MRTFTQFRALFVVLAVFAGLTAACSNSELEEAERILESAPASSETTSPDTVPEETESSPPTSEVSDADLDELAVIWQEMFTATGLPFDERVPVLETIETIDEVMIEDLANLLFQSDVADAYTYPNFTRESDGSVSIEDCVIYQPLVWESVTHLHAGIAEQTDDGGWVITGLARQTQYCVPAELAEGAIEGYKAYHQGFQEYWDPPDPEHPAIQETLTGPQLEAIPRNVAFALEAGEVLIDKDTIYPEVVDVNGPASIVISDCREVHPDSGAFDENGDPVRGTQRSGVKDRFFVEMRLTGGVWKTASFVESFYDDDCAHAPTPAGRPHV